MWLEKAVCIPLFLFLMACNDPVAEVEEPDGSLTKSDFVTFRNQAGDDVTLLIFRNQGGNYVYQSLVDRGWDPKGEVSLALEAGDYKFLFMKSTWENTTLMPSSLGSNETFDDIRIEAKADPDQPGNILPADEIFMPVAEDAGRVYPIKGGELVACTLKRAISQVLVTIKRGKLEDGKYVAEPYPEGNILEQVKEIRLDLANVATTLGIDRTTGSGKMTVTLPAASRDSLTAEGFAAFTGPFFFPPADGGKVNVTVSVVPTEAANQAIRRKTFQGAIERNRRLEVIVWLGTGPDHPIIGVEYDIEPITQEQIGDQGTWQ